MILRLRFYADPVLRKQASIIKEVTDEIRELVKDMIETMDSYNAIGLAANQVGVLKRIFVTRKEIILPDGTFALGKETVYINPVLSDPSVDQEVMLEGCLSFPKLHVDVSRPIKITVEALDLDGKPFKEVLQGFDARAVMHENDHLNGTFHIDRCSKEDRKNLDPFLRSLKEKYKHTYDKSEKAHRL